jgi:hypothetical protein
MPAQDDSSDGKPAAAPPFADLVSALRARPQPRRQRRRAADDGQAAAPPPSIE